MNNSFGIYDNSWELILETLKKFDAVEKALIFGSRAMGNDKKSSDIDLALVGEKITPAMVVRLTTALNQELPIPYFVDVLDYKTISNEALKQHIDREGKLVYARGK